MTELEEVLERLGLLRYLGRLQDEGFEKWETVLDITEQDLAALNFKLGHRRILQREIASARGIAPTQPLSLAHPSMHDDHEHDDRSQKTQRLEPGKPPQPTGKRKYRRHPKPDEHAPEKPPSAYVMFANRVRDELKGQNLSFTDIAKLVGERWKVLDPEEKESYEFQASVARDKFNSRFEEYKKTENYREYMKYLSEFKAKMNRDTKEPTEQSDATQKRPRLDSIASSTGSGNTSASSGTTRLSTSKGPGTPVNRTEPAAGSAAIPPFTPGKPSPVPQSPSTYSIVVSGASSPARQGTVAMDFASSEPPGPVEKSTLLPRIYPTIQNPHIQQQSSYLRHQPPSAPPLGASATAPRGTIVPPTPAARRRAPDAYSPIPISLSTSTTPLIANINPQMSSLDESTRSNRALPPPSSGYFDQRSTFQRRPTSQPQSPRSYGLTAPLEPHQTTYNASQSPKATGVDRGSDSELRAPPQTN